MTTNCKLNKEDDAPKMDQTMYKSMIGSLVYLTKSRRDIMQVVGLVGRFQSNPKETHVLAVKIIFRYFEGNIDYGLSYPTKKYLILRDYTDAYWAVSIDDRKNNSGSAFLLGSCLVSCLIKKLTSISLYTTEAKYIDAIS